MVNVWGLIDDVLDRSQFIDEEKERMEEFSYRHASDSWDVFICHASEDKEDFVRPLVKALQAQGLKVWYDEYTITVGDKLRRSIDRGLAKSRYGIVVLGPHFFAKDWPQDELDGLAAREVDGRKVILPIWHNIDAAGVCKYSPLLAGRVAAKSSEGMNRVVEELLKSMRQEMAEASAVRE
jgi:hypothetical protein